MNDQNNAPERIWIKPCDPCENPYDYYVCDPRYLDGRETPYVKSIVSCADSAAPEGQVQAQIANLSVWAGKAHPDQQLVDLSHVLAILDSAQTDNTAQKSESHPDDIAVERFAYAMKAKLAKKRSEGRGGWERKDLCSADRLSYLLREHVEKGDPLDVGNLAMMLHQRGERIIAAPPPACQQEAVMEALSDLLQAVCGETGFAAAVRRESGKAYPWPALDLAEAKALRALKGENHG